jgi:hypothetical protein
MWMTRHVWMCNYALPMPAACGISPSIPLYLCLCSRALTRDGDGASCFRALAGWQQKMRQMAARDDRTVRHERQMSAANTRLMQAFVLLQHATAFACDAATRHAMLQQDNAFAHHQTCHATPCNRGSMSIHLALYRVFGASIIRLYMRHVCAYTCITCVRLYVLCACMPACPLSAGASISSRRT